MQHRGSLGSRRWATACLLLATSCGLATEGSDLFETELGPDASALSDGAVDAAVEQDGGHGGKDAGVIDSGDAPPVDAGSDTEIEDASLDSDAGSDASEDPDADIPDDASVDGSPEPTDGDVPDAPPVGDGGSDAEAPDAGPCVPGADACDMDCDGVLSVACGGTDCCDTDRHVFPGQQAFFAVANNCNAFDYNCDSKEEKQFATGKACNWTFLGCDVKDGFVKDTPCGKSEVIAKCSTDYWNGCKNVTTTAIQACR